METSMSDAVEAGRVTISKIALCAAGSFVALGTLVGVVLATKGNRVELVGPAFRTLIAGEDVVCSRIARRDDRGFLCVQP